MHIGPYTRHIQAVPGTTRCQSALGQASPSTVNAGISVNVGRCISRSTHLDNFMRNKMLLELFNKWLDLQTNEHNENLLNRSNKNTIEDHKK